MFNENSQIVKVWVRLVKSPNAYYTRDMVPDLGNLREVVFRILEEEA